MTLLAEPPFVYKQKTFAADDVAGMTQALHDDGFALVPEVLSADECAEARANIDTLQPFGFDRLGNTDHFKCVFNRDPYWLDFLDKPGIIELAEATMGGECHVIGQTAWRSHPGHNGWGPHIDRLFAPMPEDMASDPRFTLPIYLCTAHFYLNDITEELCPTYVIPGSHKSGGPVTKDEDDEVTWHGKKLEPVVCKAGDVLFFRSEVWHSGSLNKTEDQTRYLIQVHYSHRHIAQQFSPYITWLFNQEVIDAATPRQLRLLGNHRQTAYD